MYREIEREFFFPSWVIQLFVVYCGPILAIGMLENAIGLSDSYTTEVLENFLVAMAGAGLARLVSSTWRDAPIEGALVWMIPTGLMAMGMIWEWVWSGFCADDPRILLGCAGTWRGGTGYRPDYAPDALLLLLFGADELAASCQPANVASTAETSDR